MRLNRWIVLVGLMGAGKTTIGHTLAHALGVPCVDTDAEIESAAAMSIAEIFERDGEAFFRQKEGQVLNRLLEGTPAIMSTGGGAFMADTNRKALLQNGFVVWLDSDLETLWARVKGKGDRPKLLTEDPLATLAALKSERDPVYAHAHLKVSAGADRAILDVVGEILEAAKAQKALEA